MAKCIFFDKNGRYKNHKDGVNSPDYFGRDDVTLNPEGLKDLVNRGVPRKHWKIVIKALEYVNGNPTMNNIVEMSQAEKNIVDAEIVEKEQEAKANLIDLDKRDIDLLVLAKMTWDEANKVRKWLKKPTITWQMFKNTYKATKEEILNFLEG